MKKGYVIIIVALVIVIIVAGGFIFVNQKRIEQLQSALRKSHQYLASSGVQLTEAVTSQKQLEQQNQKLVAYIDAKEVQENRELIGFKIEQTVDLND